MTMLIVGNILVFIGTYTGSDSKGVYLFRLDPASGELVPTAQVAETPNPSYLAVSDDLRFVYAVNEIGRFDGTPGGSVSSFAFDLATGAFELLNVQPTRGASPCHITLDPKGQYAFVANYGGGSVTVLPIEGDGRLGAPSCVVRHAGSGPDERRQKGPHAHSIWTDPTNRFVLAADLGIDRIAVYRLDREEGILTAHDPAFIELPAGAGPRHLDFHPEGRFLYVVNELDSTVTVVASDWDSGAFEVLQTVSALPDGFTGASTCADIHVSADGRFVYASNRGHDSLAIFTVDEGGSVLRPVGHVSCGGASPRSFTFDPTGDYILVANQNSDNVVVFRVDRDRGVPTPTGHEVKVSKPVCVKAVRCSPGD